MAGLREKAAATKGTLNTLGLVQSLHEASEV